MKKCKKCDIEKELFDFYKYKSNLDGLSNSCKQCSISSAKKWKEKNIDRYKELLKKWKENNKDYDRLYREKRNLIKPKKNKLTENLKEYSRNYYLKKRVSKKEIREVKLKICTKCGVEKELSQFPEKFYGKGRVKYRKYLKVCIKCRLETKEVCAKERQREYNKKWRINNKDKFKESREKTREKYKDKIRERYIQYRKNNYEKLKLRQNNYAKNKRKTDPLFKLCSLMRTRMYIFLRTKNITKRNKTFELIGCTPNELKEYLESKFTEGMSWDNYEFYGWHIDHIIPLSSGKTEEEVNKLFHYTNLQPMWSNDNWNKGRKIL